MKKLLIFGLGMIVLVGVSYQVSKTIRSEKEVEPLSKNSGSTPSGEPEGNSALKTDSGISENNTSQATGASQASGTQTTGSGSQGNGASQADKPKDNCFAFEYRHTKAAQSQDIENFLDYTNAFPILHPNFNPKSICVKVNQKSVEYQLTKYKSAPELRIGSVVGPESIIRVSYCIGKANCHEKCDAPKKRFMDDLMNNPGDDEAFSDSWGSGDSDGNQKEVKAKAKELRTIASESDSLNENSIIRKWETLQKQESYCKEKK